MQHTLSAEEFLVYIFYLEVMALINTANIEVCVLRGLSRDLIKV